MSDEEALFEVWFQLHRKKTFERCALPGEKIEDHPQWSMGMRPAYLEGWLARAGLHVTYAERARPFPDHGKPRKPVKQL